MLRAMETLRVHTAGEWRAWLEEHHASVSEVWLVFYKKNSGITSINHKDALDEALCVGWIDSLVKRLDDRRYAVKFTPRKPDSRWSDVNRKRHAELKSEGRLKGPGIARAPTGRRSASPAVRLSLPAQLPAYMQSAFKKSPAAKRNFDALPSGQRRRYFAWIESAKRDETKERRLDEAIRLLARGEQLGLK